MNEYKRTVKINHIYKTTREQFATVIIDSNEESLLLKGKDWEYLDEKKPDSITINISKGLFGFEVFIGVVR